MEDAVIAKDGLSEFAAFVRDHKIMLETAFEAPIRRDFEEDPIRALNESILSHVRLKLSKCKTKVVAGQKHNYYRIDKEWIRAMDDICLGRPKVVDLPVDQSIDQANYPPSLESIFSEGQQASSI